MFAMDPEQKRLMSIWRSLSQSDRNTLLLFAKFLKHQAGDEEDQEVVSQHPISLPKPPGESAVLALKRLKKSYPMIDTDMSMLDEATRLIMQKVMGAEDAVVIEQLEKLFENRYQTWSSETQ